MIDSLAHVPQLKVKSRNSVFRYKGKEVDVQKVGKELTVDALLTGRVVQRADSIQVSADLTNVQDGIRKSGGGSMSAKRRTSSLFSSRSRVTLRTSCTQN